VRKLPYELNEEEIFSRGPVHIQKSAPHQLSLRTCIAAHRVLYSVQSLDVEDAKEHSRHLN
jgi:hypothetical protein